LAVPTAILKGKERISENARMFPLRGDNMRDVAYDNTEGRDTRIPEENRIYYYIESGMIFELEKKAVSSRMGGNPTCFDTGVSGVPFPDLRKGREQGECWQPTCRRREIRKKRGKERTALQRYEGPRFVEKREAIF